MAKSWSGVDQGFVFEHAPEALDLVLGPMGEIGQGAFMDLFTLTAAFAQEDGRGRVTVGHGFDVHGNILSHIDFMSREITFIYMGTQNLTPQTLSVRKQVA